MKTKAQRKAMANAARKAMAKSPTAASYFCTRAAIRAEKTPEGTKALKAMLVQDHGKRFPHPVSTGHHRALSPRNRATIYHQPMQRYYHVHKTSQKGLQRLST